MPPLNEQLADAKKMEVGIKGVYAIFLRHSPHVAYIGSSKDIRGRLMAHLRNLRSGKHTNYKLKSLWKTHGEESFKFTILEECETEVQARQREQKMLDFLPPGKLYNLDNRVYNYKRSK